MPRILRNLTISDVSSVDRGAGEGVRVVLTKRHEGSLYNKSVVFGVDIGPEAEAYIKREFTQTERDSAASSGAALPDGSFPIHNKGDLKNAIQAIGRAKDPAKAKAHIKSRAASLGATDMLPDSWSKRDAEVIDFNSAKKAVLKGATDFATAQDAIETAEDAGDIVREVNEAICALNCSICSILDDEDVTDKRTAVAESFSQFQEHLSGLEFTKVDEEIDMDVTKQIEAAVAAAVAKLSTDHAAEIAKLNDAVVIAKMSDKHKAHLDSLSGDTEKAKFKGMTPEERDDAMSKMLKKSEDDPIYKAMRSENDDLRKRLEALEGKNTLEVCKREAKELGVTLADAGELLMKVKKGDIEAISKWNGILIETTKKLGAQRDEALRLGKAFDELGDSRPSRSEAGDSAISELTAKAAELRKSKPDLTEAQAFEKVLLDPANREIAARERDERMNKINRVAA